MKKILKAYLKRLTNLSSRNKSLLLTRLASEQFVDLSRTDFLLGRPAFELLGDLIQRKAKIAICDRQDPRFDKVNELSRVLRKIARTERFIEEERGTRDLFVGYPFVRGKLSDGSVLHGPLLFFPVTLSLEKEQWCLRRRDDSEISLNRSFALAYSHFNQTAIPDEVLEKTFEDFSTDPLEFRTQLYEWLKDSPFRINFNQLLFEDKLVPFSEQKATELQNEERTGELKLLPEAVLGIFPQAGSYLVPDYETLLARPEGTREDVPLLGNKGLHERNEGGGFFGIKEEQLLTPFRADVSQEEVIRAVKLGKSVVVQGPPGTGKSQVISNLMADFSARGKRVLLVCQKRAALDVVFQRLQTLGFDPFVALIHDFRNDRASLFQKLAGQIERVDDYRKMNNSLDAVVLDRQFTQESRQIDRLVEDLENFRKALFDEKVCGLAIKELYLTSDPESDSIDIQDLYTQLRFDSFETVRKALHLYATYWLRIGSQHPWYARNSFRGYGMSDLKQMLSLLNDFPEFVKARQIQFETITKSTFELHFLQNREEVKERIGDVLSLVESEAVFGLFQSYLKEPSQAMERLALVRQITDAIEGWQGIEHSLDATVLPTFRAQLRGAIVSKESGWKGKWWDWFSKERKWIEEVASANGLGVDWNDLRQLDLLVRNRIELESWLEHPLLTTRDRQKNGPQLLQRQVEFFQNCEKAADAVVRLSFAPWKKLLEGTCRSAIEKSDFKQKLSEMLDWIASWDQKLELVSVYLSAKQTLALLSEPERYSKNLEQAVRQDFDTLVEMDTLWAEMSSLEHELLNRLIAFKKDENQDPDQIVSLLDNSVRLAWIEHIETLYPVLRSVSSLKMSQWELQLQNSIESKQELSRDIALLKLREEVCADIESNRLGNRITYRDLHHQVTKKRKIWPVRKVMEHFSEEVFNLMPCWLASPESVSAMFPLTEGLFDLVIFDEASQCYAEFGLPAAFRARQVVVTGDSKQLPPSDLYVVRYEEELEEELPDTALEVGSLLDLAAQSLEQYQLKGHYRSRSLDLIDFSNQNFYQGKLTLLPDFKHINHREPAIKYVKVEGLWHQNVNEREAEKVVEVVKELTGSGLSTGVVTFNFHQQQLIQDMLEKNEMIVEGLFIKNIENVQGDERDVIIFSVGYAPDSRGKLAMQFGSLNRQGGENRLNVAVTRAREKIYIITSLWPSQLQTDDTAHEGPKVLKAYLEYAYMVSEGKFIPEIPHAKGYRTNWFLKDRLAAEVTYYKKELPFADLTVHRDEQYEGVILTDDDLYHESTSVKEPHAYLPQNLKSKNWPFERVYSREYWTKRTPGRK